MRRNVLKHFAGTTVLCSCMDGFDRLNQIFCDSKKINSVVHLVEFRFSYFCIPVSDFVLNPAYILKTFTNTLVLPGFVEQLLITS